MLYFFNISRAFGTVNHSILLDKLKHYGIRGILSLQQSVEIRGIQSETRIINCGVPQGSVLGPLLFLLCINDIHLSSALLDLHLFADDTSLVFRNDKFKLSRNYS